MFGGTEVGGLGWQQRDELSRTQVSVRTLRRGAEGRLALVPLSE